MSTIFKVVGTQTHKIKFASFNSCKKHALTETCFVRPLTFHPYIKSNAPLQSTLRIIGFDQMVGIRASPYYNSSNQDKETNID